MGDWGLSRETAVGAAYLDFDLLDGFVVRDFLGGIGTVVGQEMV